jgi:hypothetical protein
MNSFVKIRVDLWLALSFPLVDDARMEDDGPLERMPHRR